jgi:DNA-binding response OmpR family regulator
LKAVALGRRACSPGKPASEGRVMVTSPAEDAPGGRGARRVVLVVEDNPTVNGLMARILKDDGYEVIQAYDGEEGLRLASLALPDAIVMDIILPKLDGWHMLDALKRSPTMEQIPVIICSMTDQPDLGQRLGAVAFLPKPVDVEALLSRLRSLLSRTAR